MTKCYLVSEKGLFHKSIYPLDRSATIGRSAENDITITDLSVSRSHAKISLQKSSWFVEDLGSANGIVFDGERVDKAELHPGASFLLGEVKLRLMEADARNAADQLFSTLETFATTIMYESVILNKDITKPRFERLQEALQSTPIFNSLGDKEVKKLAAAANLHLFSAGQTIIWEGDLSRSLYIVLDGRVESSTKQFGGEKFQLAILESNDFFGEISLLTGEPRPMSVVATDKSLLAEITYKNMRQLMANYPQINSVLHKYFHERVKDIKKKLRETGIKVSMRHPRLRERVPVTFTLLPKKTLPTKTSGHTYQAASIHIAVYAISLLVKGPTVEEFSIGDKLKMEVELPPPWGMIETAGIISRVVPEGETAKLDIEFRVVSAQDNQTLRDFIRGEYHQDSRAHPSEFLKALEASQRGIDTSWLSTYLRIFLPITALLMLSIVGFRLFGIKDIPTARPPITIDASDSLELFMSLQTALEKYSISQESYPARLHDLVPAYLADSVHNRRLLRHLTYSLDDREGYRIRIKKGASIPGKNLVATANDIYSPKEGT
jgi:CRP-like cAMP-binding protein